MQVRTIWPAGSGLLQLPVCPPRADLHPVLSDQVSSMTSPQSCTHLSYVTSILTQSCPTQAAWLVV